MNVLVIPGYPSGRASGVQNECGACGQSAEPRHAERVEGVMMELCDNWRDCLNRSA